MQSQPIGTRFARLLGISPRRRPASQDEKKQELAGVLQELYGLPVEHARLLAKEMECAAKLARDKARSMARLADLARMVV